MVVKATKLAFLILVLLSLETITIPAETFNEHSGRTDSSGVIIVMLDHVLIRITIIIAEAAVIAFRLIMSKKLLLAELSSMEKIVQISKVVS